MKEYKANLWRQIAMLPQTAKDIKKNFGEEIFLLVFLIIYGYPTSLILEIFTILNLRAAKWSRVDLVKILEGWNEDLPINLDDAMILLAITDIIFYDETEGKGV